MSSNEHSQYSVEEDVIHAFAFTCQVCKERFIHLNLVPSLRIEFSCCKYTMAYLPEEKLYYYSKTQGIYEGLSFVEKIK